MVLLQGLGLIMSSRLETYEDFVSKLREPGVSAFVMQWMVEFLIADKNSPYPFVCPTTYLDLNVICAWGEIYISGPYGGFFYPLNLDDIGARAYSEETHTINITEIYSPEEIEQIEAMVQL